MKKAINLIFVIEIIFSTTHVLAQNNSFGRNNMPNWNSYTLSKEEFMGFVKVFKDSIRSINSSIKDMQGEIKLLKGTSSDKRISELNNQINDEVYAKNRFEGVKKVLNTRAIYSYNTRNVKFENEAILNIKHNSKEWNSFLDLKKGDDISRATELFGGGGKDMESKKAKDSKGGSFRELVYEYNGKRVIVLTYELSTKLIREIRFINLEGKEFLKHKVSDKKIYLVGLKRQKIRDAMNYYHEKSYTTYENGYFNYNYSEGNYVGFFATESDQFNISEIALFW